MTAKQNDIDSNLQQLRDFARGYQYDTAYLERVLGSSPGGFGAFGAAQGLGAYRKALSVEAHFVARVAVMLAEDCGGCTQLNLRMAVEQGVSRQLLEQVLAGSSQLPSTLADVREHAMAVAGGGAPDRELSARLIESLGEEAFVELALTITGSRIYPSLKRALDQVGSCSKPGLDF